MIFSIGNSIKYLLNCLIMALFVSCNANNLLNLEDNLSEKDKSDQIKEQDVKTAKKELEIKTEELNTNENQNIPLILEIEKIESDESEKQDFKNFLFEDEKELDSHLKEMEPKQPEQEIEQIQEKLLLIGASEVIADVNHIDKETETEGNEQIILDKSQLNNSNYQGKQISSKKELFNKDPEVKKKEIISEFDNETVKSLTLLPSINNIQKEQSRIQQKNEEMSQEEKLYIKMLGDLELNKKILADAFFKNIIRFSQGYYESIDHELEKLKSDPSIINSNFELLQFIKRIKSILDKINKIYSIFSIDNISASLKYSYNLYIKGWEEERGIFELIKDYYLQAVTNFKKFVTDLERDIKENKILKDVSIKNIENYLSVVKISLKKVVSSSVTVLNSKK